MIRYYDKYGKEIPFKDFIEVQWNRKYDKCGDFTVYMAAKDYDEAIKYIKNDGRPETGIVQKTNYERKPEGEFITLSGFFIEKLAEAGAYWCDVGISGTDIGASGVRELILLGMYHTLSQFKTKEPIPDPGDFSPIANNMYCTTINAKSIFPDSIDMLIEAGRGTGLWLYDFCNENEMSYYCNPIFNDKSKEATQPMLGLDFVFFKGRDLKDKVYFGEAFNDVKKIDYIFDDSACKPHYEVIQQVEDKKGFANPRTISTPDGIKHYISETVIQDANCPSDLGKMYPVKVLHTNVSGMDMVSANGSKIRKQMRQQATLDMLNNYKVENISVDVLQERFIYLEDYNLGDICTVVSDSIEKSYFARIKEIYEVHSQNKVEIQVILGTPQKQKYRKVV